MFRWPSIMNGTLKGNLGSFIITLVLPGIPLLIWGQEQAFHILDNTASNYVYGRQPMGSNTAWQNHGCYKLGNSRQANWPSGPYLDGCGDDWNSLDHRDPSHPVRNILTTMFEMRRRYPVLNDGFQLQTLSKSTCDIYLPASEDQATETGLWSVMRSRWSGELVVHISIRRRRTDLVTQNSRILPVKVKATRQYGLFITMKG